MNIANISSNIIQSSNQNPTNNPEDQKYSEKKISGMRVSLAVVGCTFIGGIGATIGMAASFPLGGVLGVPFFLGSVSAVICKRDDLYIKEGQKALPFFSDLCPPKDDKSIKMEAGQQVV